MAGILSTLGTEVSLVTRKEQALRNFDDVVRFGLHEAMEKQGIRHIPFGNVTAVRESGDGGEAAMMVEREWWTLSVF